MGFSKFKIDVILNNLYEFNDLLSCLWLTETLSCLWLTETLSCQWLTVIHIYNNYNPVLQVTTLSCLWLTDIHTL